MIQPRADLQESPRTAYEQRLQARRGQLARMEGRHRNLGNARVAVFACAAVLAYMAWFRHALSAWWLLVPGAIFVALVLVHDRVLREHALLARAVSHYERCLARLGGQWSGHGETGERFRNTAHPYSEDLDLFGKGSLFEMLSTARTHMGEEALAAWLQAPASPEVVVARQQSVAELRPRLDIREDLAVLGDDVCSGVHPEPLAAWAEQTRTFGSPGLRAQTIVLSVIGVLALVAICATGVAELGLFTLAPTVSTVFRDLFLVAIVVNGGFLLRHRKQVARVLREVEAAAGDLDLLAAVLVRLEKERFDSPLLLQLRAALDCHGSPPSRRIARLDRLVQLVDSRDSLPIRLFGPFVLFDVHLALGVERWRADSGGAVRRWLAAVGDMEALTSIASYTYEHPADVFAELVAEDPWLEGEGLAHPLLPESRAVPNDVKLGGDLRVLIVSGSNMSGKSTLLRTVGTNVALAQAGAPVRARRLRLSPLAIGASIRILDSLQDGSSRFYAELTRLRRIVDLTNGPLPVLFLLDEFLHGTNSHDRRIGAAAIVRNLVDRGAIGLITTHDLALADIAVVLAPRGANVHFEDHLENGRMRFDYRMHPGVVRKSNALELMRSIGLEV